MKIFGHRFFDKAKDGGPKSTVTGYWLCEIKSLFSVALLKFEDGSRDEFHSHAFDSVNWVLKGRVVEETHDSMGWHPDDREWLPSLRPVLTLRETFHRVRSDGTTWVLSLRGPWSKTWWEYEPATGKYTELTHGRQVVRSL